MAHIFMFIPLLALVLFVFLPWQLALPLYLPIAISSLAIARKAMQAQHLPLVNGKEAMLGDRAVVVAVSGRKADVHYRGETWHALSSQPLHPGQQVIIEAVEGLTLRVIPAPTDGMHTQ
jgi:membrane protein implicated in regulation of membrane protease activity